MSEYSVLLVDDENRILSAFTRQLHEEDVCHVKTAPNASVALELLSSSKDIAAVFSDYYMPGMNGIDFLAEVRKINPDITRVLVTGAAEIKIAIDAINVGQIFRLLTKPCPEALFIQTVRDAIRQYELLTSEKILLNKTLNGAVKTLVDILALFSPEVFAQASRLRDMAHQMAKYLPGEQGWEVELSALLCQIGCVTVPREILEKSMNGDVLTGEEQKMINHIPESGRLLLKNIPRMETIGKAIYHQNAPYKSSIELAKTNDEQVPRISYMLNILLQFDQLFLKYDDPVQAYAILEKNKTRYDPELMQIFKDKVLHLDLLIRSGKFKVILEEEELSITNVTSGRIISRDIIDIHNHMVVAKNTVISEVLKMRLFNYIATHRINKTIWVYVEAPADL